MNTPSHLFAAMLATPKTHAVVTTFEDGRMRRFETRSAGSAEVYAVGERRKVGRSLINRDTGDVVTVSSVTIECIQ